MRWIFIGVCAISVLTVTAFVWLTNVPQNNQHTFYTSVISESDSVNNMTLFGKIWIDEETTIVPLADGTVTDVKVSPGDKVKAGDILASLDIQAEDFEQYEKLKKLTQDSGSITALNKALKDISKLEKKGFYDALEASKKRSEVYSSLSQFMNYRSELQKQFDLTHGKILRAPFDGVVTDVRLKKGQRVSIKDERIDISIMVAPKNYKLGVELEVSDELLFRINKGQELLVSVPLSMDQVLKGIVTSISSQAYDDKKKRYFKVLGEVFPEKMGKMNLASGMKVVIDVNTVNEENLTWIPKAALDIHLDDHLVSAKMNFIKKPSRSVASSKMDDFSSSAHSDIDTLRDQSNVSRLISNDVFPLESHTTEVYLLTADNRVIQASIQKVRESGEMVAIEGKDLLGMRVITHYRPKGLLW
jgi:RND family efflux transporter MFP subunit